MSVIIPRENFFLVQLKIVFANLIILLRKISIWSVLMQTNMKNSFHAKNRFKNMKIQFFLLSLSDTISLR